MNAGQGTALPAPHDPGTTRALVAGTGALLLGGLAAILAGGPAVLAIALAACGVLLAACAWAPAAFARVRRHRGWIVVLAIAPVLAWWLERSVSLISGTALPTLEPSLPVRFPGVARPDLIGRAPLVAVTVLLAMAGLVLVSDAVRVWLGLTPRQRAPWKQMTEVQPRATPIAWRAVSGVVLAVVAALLTIDLAGPYIAGNPMLEVLMLMVVVAGASTIVGTPLVVGALIRFDQDRSGGARERDRQRFAAHLHDSVLQTLALVQRQANDPVAVARLARRQEYALRAWMAGEAELHAETLGSALRDAVAGSRTSTGSRSSRPASVTGRSTRPERRSWQPRAKPCAMRRTTVAGPRSMCSPRSRPETRRSSSATRGRASSWTTLPSSGVASATRSSAGWHPPAGPRRSSRRPARGPKSPCGSDPVRRPDER